MNQRWILLKFGRNCDSRELAAIKNTIAWTWYYFGQFPNKNRWKKLFSRQIKGKSRIVICSTFPIFPFFYVNCKMGHFLCFKYTKCPILQFTWRHISHMVSSWESRERLSWRGEAEGKTQRKKHTSCRWWETTCKISYSRTDGDRSLTLYPDTLK